jgi:uncharacterized membrane protein YeaQ/YmgE (transglycosylase-associated protein family)
MSADDSADPGRQRTVAELLAQHGGGKPAGSRRRRRAPEDDDEPESAAAQTGGSQVEGTGGVARDDPPARDASARRSRRSGGSGSADPQLTSTPYPDIPAAPQVPEQRWAGAAGYGRSIDPITGAPIDPPSGQTFGVAPTNSAAGATGPYRSMPLARTDPPTEEMPLYPETGWAARAKDGGGPGTGPMAEVAGRAGAGGGEGPATGHVSRADLFEETDDEDDDDSDETWGRRASAAPAGLAERGAHGELADEDPDYEDREERATGWFWLFVQWVLGAVAGALLWVGFSYLWMHFPVVALIAAVLATAVLVLVVRAIRRRDDLQTTMLAVLVGLVVTISPAVLLLAVR